MKILFVCYANACRSQMAEAYARARAPEGVEVGSAGLIAAGVHPRARDAMGRRGVTMKGQWSKTIDEVDLESYDVVIALSEKAYAQLRLRRGPFRLEPHAILDPVGVRGTEAELTEVFDLCGDDVAEVVDAFFRQEFSRSARPQPRPDQVD